MASQGQSAASIFDINLRPGPWVVLAVVVAIVIIGVPLAQAQTYTVLHTFTGGNDGAMPIAGLTMDAAGNFYGATYVGGTTNSGVVFKLTRAGLGWVLSPLYEFQGGEDGAGAAGGVTIGPDGALYGTTYEGGLLNCNGPCGIVYRLAPPPSACKSVSCPWTKTVLHQFGVSNGDGFQPLYGSPVFDHTGNLYGTTHLGGAYDRGTVYELTPSSGGWTENILWNFTGGNDGGQPFSSLIFDGAGNLYGTATEGGAEGAGAAFELSPADSEWSETVLFSFTFPGTGDPEGGLAWDAQGNLYGATPNGGQYNYGTAFQVTPSGGWTYKQLEYFRCCGGPISTPTLDSAGNLYVSAAGTEGDGAIIKLTQSQGTWISTMLHQFQGSDGAYPDGSVTLDGNGNIYGTTFEGGSDNQGVIFEITP
ncbi:MAG: choice-of-anchor tandem repeat GloVer-containing protein [Candidatus Korobacteraceae bacterium]